MTSASSEVRSSVESIIMYSEKILLVKRSPDCKVAPGVWNVPAGKVKKDEKPEDAAVREPNEETGLVVCVIKLLAEQTFEITDNGKKVLRHMYTYLTELDNKKMAAEKDAKENNSKDKKSFPQVKLNNEHSEYAWVSLQDLLTEKYEPSGMDPIWLRLKELIKKAFNEGKKNT